MRLEAVLILHMQYSYKSPFLGRGKKFYPCALKAPALRHLLPSLKTESLKPLVTSFTEAL